MPELKDHDVTVVIVAHNSGAFLQPCVDALARQTFSDFQAIIVDNASTDDAVETIELPDDRFHVVRLSENIGFAAANNHAVAKSEARWIATLNPDTVPYPDWLENLISATGRWTGVAAFGSTQLQLDDPTRIDGAGDVWHAAGVGWRALENHRSSEIPEEGETFAACAAGALYDRARFDAVGGFDESFFCYYEDVDIAFRLRAKGWGVVQVADAILLHAGSGTTGKNSEFTLYYGHRNRIRTFVKNTPGWLFWLLLPGHIALNLRMLSKSPDEKSRRILSRVCRETLRDWRSLREARIRAERERTLPVLEYFKALAWRPRLITERGFLKDSHGGRRSHSSTAVVSRR